jgi:phosphatidylserine/phosphatidylglycerophosphate/cardiolipin synthase-like enzyme
VSQRKTRSSGSSRQSTNTLVTIAVLVIVIILSCIYFFTGSDPFGLFATQTAPAVATAPVSDTAMGGLESGGSSLSWLQVYFTNPDPPDNLSNGIDRYVVEVLNQAQKTIDVTSFDFNLPSVTNALVDASQRGVTVRVVLDQENGSQTLKGNELTGNKDFDAVKTLKKASIPVVNGGRSNGLMHDKMIIVDSQTLFMGSWNMSYNDTFRNNNNLLQITDPDLIANYQAKFDELFVDKLFGTHAQVGALKPSLVIGGVKVENYFSPVDKVMDKLIKYVQSAKKSVHFIIFTYTDKDLAQVMIERTRAGVEVQGIIETRGASQGAFVPLYCAKLPVKEDGNKYTMHHKVIIIDGKFVITGSFNFTKSADEVNDDNILVIYDPMIAGLYEKEFQKVYSIGNLPDSRTITCP